MARESRETWAKRVERWKDSGLTAREFASELGVRASALSWWKWQLGRARAALKPKRTAKAQATVPPLTFVEMTPPVPSEPLEMVLTSGIRIRVPVGFHAETLGRLIAVVDKR